MCVCLAESGGGGEGEGVRTQEQEEGWLVYLPRSLRSSAGPGA